MPADPQTQAILQALAQMPAMDYSTLTAPVLRAAMAAMSPPAKGDAVAAIENREISGAGGPLKLRLYRPAGAGPFPVTMFFHGGGFVICDLDSHDNICSSLANRAGSLVVSVDYRRAPEAPFPAAVEDAVAATRWAHLHAEEIGGDASRIAVAGDSAGGNLAAVTAQLTRDGGPELCHQLLLYPVTDCAMNTASYREFGEGHYLTAEMMRWFLRQYLQDPARADDPRASPLRQHKLAGLPDATVFTAECDPLRDEGEAYARALLAAGNAVHLQRWPGQIHGFISMTGVLDSAQQALDAAAAALRSAFAVAPVCN
ncbi:MAG: alpha/beta hydrolase [Stenotrophobium sp.]